MLLPISRRHRRWCYLLSLHSARPYAPARLQEGTTRRILDHCGLSWHPAMLRFYDTPRFVHTASLLQARTLPAYLSAPHCCPACLSSVLTACCTNGLTCNLAPPWLPSCAIFPLTPNACPPACPSLLQVRRPIYTTSVGKWAAYKDGLAPLLLHLRSTILAYEERAGLPSSRQLLDELQQQAAQGQAAHATEQQAQQAAGTCSAPGEDGGAGSCGADGGGATRSRRRADPSCCCYAN
jgi:hypothetical protein